jgi:hypothetical protein
MATIKLRPDAETEWTEIVTLRGLTGATAQDAITALKAEPDAKSILALQARVAKLEDIVLGLVKRL